MLTEEEYDAAVIMIVDSGVSVTDACALLDTASRMNFRWIRATS
jgi:hypothetical protein